MTTATHTSNELSTIPTPHLADADRGRLLSLLEAVLDGKKVEMAIRYHKVTTSKPRKAGVDYKKRLSHGPEVLEGRVLKVAKGKNGWYALMDATLTRQPIDAEGAVITSAIGWTAIKGQGIDAVLGGTINGKDVDEEATAQ